MGWRDRLRAETSAEAVAARRALKSLAVSEPSYYADAGDAASYQLARDQAAEALARWRASLAVCPTCLGDGGWDQRDLNASIRERLSDRELAHLRRSLDLDSDWLACDVCGGSGRVPESVRRDILAASRAAVDQLVTGIERGDFDAKLARMGIPREKS